MNSQTAIQDTLGTTLGPMHGSVFEVVFSPNGKTLATGSYDGTAKLWSVPDIDDLNLPN